MATNVTLYQGYIDQYSGNFLTSDETEYHYYNIRTDHIDLNNYSSVTLTIQGNGYVSPGMGFYALYDSNKNFIGTVEIWDDSTTITYTKESDVRYIAFDIYNQTWGEIYSSDVTATIEYSGSGSSGFSIKELYKETKDEFDSAYTILKDTILNIIEDKKYDETEKVWLDNAFNNYRTASSNYNSAYTKALDSISQDKTDNLKYEINDSMAIIENRVNQAELKITDDAIISTVTSSTEWTEQSTYIDYTYQYADSNANNIWELSERVNQAELKITDEAIISTVRSTSDYWNDLDGKVNTTEVISSINQTAESIKIQADKIQLEGTVTAGDTNGNYIHIDDANYTVRDFGTPKAFFGFRNMGSSGFDNYVVPKLAMGANGVTTAAGNFFTIIPYFGEDNPESCADDYVDLAYATWVTADNGAKMWSNIKMYGDGNVKIDAVNNLEITSNQDKALTNDSGHEKRIALFTTSGYDWLNEHIQTGGVSNHSNIEGLILSDRYRAVSWDGSQNYGGTHIASVRVHCNTSGEKFFMPTYESGVIYNGGSNYRWKTVYSVNALNASSDRNLKENIEYLCSVPNPNAKTNIELTTSDMYNFVKDDLYISKYNFKGESEEKIGFIAQDIVDTKVGSKIITCNREMDNTLGYDTSNYTNVLAGALKEAINEIEKLKKEVNILKNEILELKENK